MAIDHVLATQKDETSEKNVFNELEGVDKAVATACSGVIRALLQVCFVALLLIDRQKSCRAGRLWSNNTVRTYRIVHYSSGAFHATG